MGEGEVGVMEREREKERERDKQRKADAFDMFWMYISLISFGITFSIGMLSET